MGIRGTNPHLKHALERRQYPLCGRETLSVYPPTDYTRQQRSAYGHTHADRPSASKCRRLPGKLEAARRAAKRKPRRPICTPPASACVRARHPTRARICVRVVDSDRALALRARRCPMDAPRRLSSRPRHEPDGTARRMRARHPTRNRVYTLAAPRGIEIRIRTKQTNIHPGPLKSESRSRLSGPKNGRLPAGGAEFGAAARG